MKYTKAQYKRAIEDLEYCQSGFKNLNGVSVECKRVMIDEELKTIYADITIYYDADGRQETITNVDYELDKVEEWIKNGF